VPKSLEVALALATDDAQRRHDVALSLVQAATPPDAHTLYLCHTVPGLSKLLSLGLLDAMPNIAPWPTGQDCVSYGRRVKGAKESAGKHVGTSGKKLRHAHLQEAFAAAAAWCLRHHPAGQPSGAR
jgi:hypothetical protein